MRIRHIEVFYHVYREGSISEAARNLFVSQPSVSKVLRHAEDQLGFPLFDRRKGRLYPTDAGTELFREVSEIYDRVSALNRTASNIRGRKGGHLRIGVLPSLGFAIVPPMVAKLRAANPDASFDLSTLHSEEITTALLEKRFDLCIGFDDEFDDRIRCQTINAVGIALLAQRGMFDDNAKAISPDTLDRKEMIGLRDSGPVADRIEVYLANAGVEPVVAISAQTYYVAAELVKLGAGFAIVDGFTAKRFANEDVQSFALDRSPTLPFVAMTLAEESGNALVEDAIATLTSLFG
ncbi:LysR family transcriptional regulator [Erythrobacter crassostreae]|uniref:LysR family transcriptional regulator n=1 Tax=Erythrobacter crassostreae TaxID=2828328 RepID=A0A9X1F5F1_9SPHN|nr:LysR family transcriptional regulator [Erythrobacter crassostrea]MBV7260286.1 LysR family transcriptional regulator [Erythrobacter crassostrea]